MEYIKVRLGNFSKTGDTSSEESAENLFQHSFNPMFSFSERIWKPHMDILETVNEIIVLAEIAGVDKDDIVIEVCEDAVKIKGKRVEKLPVKDATYRLFEIQHGAFERLIRLPTRIDTDRVSAIYANGFLQINLVKKPHKNDI